MLLYRTIIPLTFVASSVSAEIDSRQARPGERQLDAPLPPQAVFGAPFPWSPNYSGATYHAPSINILPVKATPGIRSDAYLKLTRLIPKVLTNAISISSHSWELGALTQSLLEVYNPEYTPFRYTPYAQTIPDAMIKVALSSLYATAWNGAPSSTYTTGRIAHFLDDTPQSRLRPAPLIPGDGALGDPASLGPSTYLLAQLAGRDDVRRLYTMRAKEDYAWAAGNQMAHLIQGTKSGNGTISQREGYFELWADMGYMIPPFPAYLGLATGQIERFEFAIDQWLLEASALYDPVEHLYRHVHYWDSRFWATGQAWILGGAMRIVSPCFSEQLADRLKPIEDQIFQVFYSAFGKLDSNNLVPNYMNDPDPKLFPGDSSGTALIVASFYRYTALFPGRMNQWAFEQAGKAFTGVVNKMTEEGWATQVVDPNGTNGFLVNPDLKPPMKSPEAQSFCGMMWAARTAAGV